MTMLIILAVFALAMFWMSSKQRKTQKAAMEFIDTLAPGQRVMTASGYIGTVVSVDGDHFTLESVPGGGTTTWIKGAIRKLVEEPVEVETTPTTSAVAQDDAVQDFVVPNDISKLIDRPSSDGTSK